MLVVGALGGLAVMSWWFNQWVDAQAETDPLGGYAAVQVVLGVSYTLAGAGVVLAALLDVKVAIEAVGIMAVCFAASGLPMMVGDMRRSARRRRDLLTQRREE